MSKYNKNFILSGDIDYYCLLCKELFNCIPDIEKHIRWEKHRKIIKNQAYFPKFRKDYIYKIANFFYCEICNFVGSDIAAVTEHINSEKHKALKNNAIVHPKNFPGQYDSGYIVINKVIINMAQWNSIVDNKCHICDINVSDVNEHLTSEKHTIKLIQSETTYEDERYYRKIHEDKYHCFTCKKVFDAKEFYDHWPTCENIDEIEIKKLKQAGSSKHVGTMTDDIEKKLVETLQEFYFVDEKSNLATCKYCSTVVAINFKAMIEHMKNQHDAEDSKAKVKKNDSDESSEDEVVFREVPDNGKRRSELAKYGKEHSIKLNHNGSKGWCLICDRYLSAHKNLFREHIRGAIHRGHLELQGLKNPKPHSDKKFDSKSILEYTFKYERRPKESKKLSTFRNEIECSINVYSLFFLNPIEGNPHFKKTKCYACNILFLQGQEREHCETTAHKDIFIAAKVLKVVEQKDSPLFVREIRPNLFHCGSCNMTLPFPENLEKHITTDKHLQLLMEANLYIKVFSGNTEPDTSFETVNIPSDGDLYAELLRYGFENK